MNTLQTINQPHQAIAASAGTGKTFRLACRYLGLLASGAEPERIVALTFSRKAAGEILERIVSLLCKWIDNPDSFKRDSAGQDFPDFPREKMLIALHNILLGIHKLKIGTLDSFYVGILHNFPFELGMHGRLEMLGEQFWELAQQDVLRRALEELSDHKARREFLNEFRLSTFGGEQKRFEPQLLDFVKGCHEIYRKLPDPENAWGAPERICPGSKHILKRGQLSVGEYGDLLRLLPECGYSESSMTSWGNFIAEVSQMTPDRKLSKTADAFFRDKLIANLSALRHGDAVISIGNNKKINGISPKACKLLVELSEYLLRCMLEPRLNASGGVGRILRRYDSAYTRFLLADGRFTFSDIIHLLANGAAPLLTQEEGESGRLYISYRLDSRYDHWLLDEFQDTSRAQWRILSSLIDELMQSRSGERSFFYVGDIKQAIYAWRDGDARLFEEIFSQYREFGNMRRVELSKSYRSALPIIDTVNRIFLPLAANPPGEPFESALRRFDFREHSTARTELSGFAAIIEYEKEKPAITGEEQPDTAEKGVSPRSRLIAKLIREINPFSRGRDGKPLSVAVLVRKNDTAQLIVRELQSMGLKVALEGKVPIADNPLTAAFLSLLRLAEHPGDKFARQHVAMSPFARVLPENPASLLLRDIQEMGFGNFVRKWGASLNDSLPGGLDPFSAQRLEELAFAALEFDRQGSRDTLDFVEFIQSYGVPLSGADQAVQLLTIHKSKGLDYDIVIVPELAEPDLAKADVHRGLKVKLNVERKPEWALFMPPRDYADAIPELADFCAELDEEHCYECLCVLYVALTRAKRGLYMLLESAGKSAGTGVSPASLLRRIASEREQIVLDKSEYSCIYREGNALWYSDEVEIPPLPTAPEASFTIDFSMRAKRATPSGAELPALEKTPNPFLQEENRGLELGNAVHELFSLLEWSDEVPCAELISEWRRRSQFSDECLDEAEELFHSALRSPVFAKSLSKPDSGVPELWRERRFDLLLDGEWISGSFDRVLIDRAADGGIAKVLLQDFKSDRGGMTTESIETYRPQMEMYRRALAFLLNLPQERIRAELLFLRSGAVVAL